MEVVKQQQEFKGNFYTEVISVSSRELTNQGNILSLFCKNTGRSNLLHIVSRLMALYCLDSGEKNPWTYEIMGYHAWLSTRFIESNVPTEC